MFAEVAPAIPLSSSAISQTYTYRVPTKSQKLIAAGSPVTIPLGRQVIDGTVLRIHSDPVPYPTKTLTLKDNPPLTTGQLEFAQWISTTLHGGLGYTLRLFPPPVALPRAGAMGGKPTKKSPTANLSVSTLIIEKNDLQRFARIRDCIATDVYKQVLIIVPEVSLAEPLRQSLATNFKDVHAYHSDRTHKQLALVWQLVHDDKPVVVIGTQKALFLPWRTLTHVIIEEEHLDTHKLWDQYPRLDNRYAAQELAVLNGSRLAYVSSSLSPARALDLEQKKVQPISNGPVAPKIKIMPITFDDRRRGHFLPPAALEHIQAGLRKREKIVILHNQRGSWKTVMCAKCHNVLRCPECTSTVFVEGPKNKQRVHCRQCAYVSSFPSACPHCGHTKLRVFGPGTTKSTDVLHMLVPKAKLLEITAGHLPSSKSVATADIIVGTTALWRATSEAMFDRALWLFPESTLLYPDYRSSERAWEILVRLQKKISSRRAVGLITRYPDLIKQALVIPPEKHLQQLLHERKKMNYPPYVDLVKLTKYGRSEAAALKNGRELREKLEAAVSNQQKNHSATVTIRGPYQGFSKKEDQKFAVHFLLTGPLDQLVPLYKNLPIDRADLSPAQIL